MPEVVQSTHKVDLGKVRSSYAQSDMRSSIKKRVSPEQKKKSTTKNLMTQSNLGRRRGT